MFVEKNRYMNGVWWLIRGGLNITSSRRDVGPTH